MTRLLTEHEGASMARVLRKLADDLEEGTRQRGDITRANSWDGNLKGANLDPGRGGDATDPTGQAATTSTHWTSHIAGDIAHTARAAVRAASSCSNDIRRIPAPVEATDNTDAMTARIALANENLRAGWCQCCGKECNGDRDSRLTKLVAAWTVWSSGVEVEHSHDRMVCAGCREAWRRASDRGEAFLEWERRRQQHQEREPA